MKLIKSILVTVFLLSVSGCFPGADGGSNTTFLSDIDVRCTLADVTNCDVNSFQGKDILIGLIFDKEQTCVSYLESILTKYDFSQAFDVTAFGVTASNSSTLGAAMSNPWVDVVAAPVSAVNAGISQISVCGFMDLDSNGRLSSGDAYYDAAYSTFAGVLDLVQWNEY
ncbi:hypothetical protein N9W41_01325 [bacterium]|nr:hypothetical protein [bacterium]